MPVFAVLPDNPIAIAGKVTAVIPQGNALQLPGGAWLVVHAGTSRELAELLGIAEGMPTGGVVLPIASYWGRADPSVWEWLTSKMK